MGKESGPDHILIAGLGNVLLQDDGVGVHAVTLLQDDADLRSADHVVVAEVGTAVLDALHLFEWADRILAIDAMRAGHAPGTVYFTDDRNVREETLRSGLHELSLLGAFRLMPNHPRPPIGVLGVEPERIDYGMELSPPVAAALPRVITEAKAIIRRWEARSTRTPAPRSGWSSPA